MKYEVGGFRDDLVVGFCYRGECNLETFLANFLRNPFRAFGEQTRGVASLWAFGYSPFYHALQRAEESKALRLRDQRIAEAGCRTLVAHRAVGPGGNEQGVTVTVGAN